MSEKHPDFEIQAVNTIMQGATAHNSVELVFLLVIISFVCI